MDSPQVYYKRTTDGNQIGQWLEVHNNPRYSHYRDWIRSYFQQPLRDIPVTVVTQTEDGYDIALTECIAETNDKFTGVTTGGQRIELLWSREDRINETLARYR